MLARIDPTTAEVATSVSPARSANSAMKSSGRLPRALWTTPVVPGLMRSDSWSTARPASAARAPTAAPLTPNASTAFTST